MTRKVQLRLQLSWQISLALPGLGGKCRPAMASRH
jgi:hypothetical protein